MNSITQDVKGRYRARVLECRLQAGIAKQKDLAELTGIPHSVLSELESNKTFLSSSYALRIKEVCGCSLDELYEVRTSKKVATTGDNARHQEC